MDLLDVRISEIKNLNLINLYSTDSIFTKEENKFLGLRVVYNNNKDYINLDFKDEHFSSLVKRVLSRYNQEKDNRNIVLLGDLTKKLLSDKVILNNAEERQSFNREGIALFDSKKDRLRAFEPFLNQILVDILKTLKNYEAVKIDNIDGFNNKYLLHYSLGSVKKTVPMIINFIDDETIGFSIGAIDGLNLNVKGKLKNAYNLIEGTWISLSKNVNGYIKYDVIKDEIERKIVVNDKTMLYEEDGETILDEDIELVNFYLNLFGINWDHDVIKTNTNNYIFGYSRDLIEEEKNLLKENHGMQLYVKDDRVILKYKIKNGISKYDNLLNVELEYTLCELTLTKVLFEGIPYVLLEKITSNNFGKKYDYEVYKVGDINFTKPFDTEEKYDIDIEPKSLHDIKMKVLGLKGDK